jgi:flagellar basal body-associated protein FliL
LRNILFILLLFLLYKLIAPLFRGIFAMFSSAPKKREPVEKKPDYSELSPYEIEDAEYEEIRKTKD